MYKVNSDEQIRHDSKKHKPLTCGLSHMDLGGMRIAVAHIRVCSDLIGRYCPHSLAGPWENPGRQAVRDKINNRE
jgi:hypothetical protein